MAYERLTSFMAYHNIPPDQFNHFDYVDALQQLSQIELYNHPRKRRLVEQFASKCLKKLEQEEQMKSNKAKVNNFLQRTKQYQSMRQQKIEAMRFLQQKYDKKTNQLKFYPKTNRKMATQRGKCWKDVDGFDNISIQSKINMPNESSIDNQSYMTFNSK